MKQKLPPFVGVKSRTAGSVDVETGVRRVKEGPREGEGRKGQMERQMDAEKRERVDGDSP